MAKTLERVYTSNLINEKEISIKYALLMIDRR